VGIGYGYNLSSLQAQRRLADTSERLALTSERLSSGMRINRPSDDAASLAVASGLNTNARIFNQAIRNINDGASLLNVVDGALSEMSSLLQRQIELASQAANGTYSSAQRSSLNAEAQALRDEYNRTVQTTSIFGRAVLHGQSGQTTIQAGTGAANTYALKILDPSTAQNLTYTGLGTYSTKTSSTTAGTIYNADVGDFNEDGRTDVIAFEQLQNGSLYFELFTADSQGQLIQVNEGVIANPGSQGFTYEIDEFIYQIGDGNGDGHLDVSIYYGLNGYDGIGGSSYHSGEYVLYGNGRGGLDPGAVSQSFQTAPTPTVDLNGDGVTDSISTNTNSLTSNIQNTLVSENLHMNSFSLTTQVGARSALTTLQSTLSYLSSKRGAIGTMQSRLGIGLNNLTSQREGYISAATRISEADMAQESAHAVRLQILQKTAAAVLLQANLAPQIALSLLR
jgi:flagellin